MQATAGRTGVVRTLPDSVEKIGCGGNIGWKQPSIGPHELELFFLSAPCAAHGFRGRVGRDRVRRQRLQSPADRDPVASSDGDSKSRARRDSDSGTARGRDEGGTAATAF